MLRAPALLAGIYLALLMAAAPGALAVRDAIRQQLGSSTWAEDVASRADIDWLLEFGADARGLAADLQPSIVGFGAVLRNLDDLGVTAAAGRPAGGASRQSWTIVGLWLIAGTFLSGGILDRYARRRPLRLRGFFGACGHLFFRLLRLNVLVAGLYVLVLSAYGWLARLVYEWATHDLASERTAFLWMLLLGVAGALLALGITIVADCARVRTVVEDRRSMLFALAAGARVAGGHAATLTGLYVLILATLALVTAAYAAGAPGAQGGGLFVWIAFGVTQLYILARVAVKLLTYASVTAFFQSALAHAGYAAQPMPVWPESPAIESLGVAADR